MAYGSVCTQGKFEAQWMSGVHQVQGIPCIVFGLPKAFLCAVGRLAVAPAQLADGIHDILCFIKFNIIFHQSFQTW